MIFLWNIFLVVFVFFASVPTSSGVNIDDEAKKYGWPTDQCTTTLQKDFIKVVKFESPSGSLTQYNLNDVIEVRENSVEKILLYVRGGEQNQQLKQAVVEDLSKDCPLLDKVLVEEPKGALDYTTIVINYIARKKCVVRAEGFLNVTIFLRSAMTSPLYNLVLKLRVIPQDGAVPQKEHKPTQCDNWITDNGNRMWSADRIVGNHIDYNTYQQAMEHDTDGTTKGKLTLATWDIGQCNVTQDHSGEQIIKLTNIPLTTEPKTRPFMVFDFEVNGTGRKRIFATLSRNGTKFYYINEFYVFPGVADYVRTLNLGDLSTGPMELIRVIGYQVMKYDGAPPPTVYTPNAESTTYVTRTCNDGLKTDELVFVLKGAGDRMKVTAKSVQADAVLVAYANRMGNRLVTIPFEGFRYGLKTEDLEVTVENETTSETKNYFLKVGACNSTWEQTLQSTLN